MYLALDTSQLWGQYGIVRLSVIYRGRGVPRVWTVWEHQRSTVAYENYKTLFDQAATLLPPDSRVCFLADRGFADTDLMAHLNELGWDWRIRIKSSFCLYRDEQFLGKTGQITPAKGQASFYNPIQVTEKTYGPVHLAVANPMHRNETWMGLSNRPVSEETFDEYGYRFDIEETFLDDKSNGFQLESSQLRSAAALTRLCLVLAITTLFLVSQGTDGVDKGLRRQVDPHWSRGDSYLKIGWKWVKKALCQGLTLIKRLFLSPKPHPEPARASKKQVKRRKRKQITIALTFFT